MKVSQIFKSNRLGDRLCKNRLARMQPPRALTHVLDLPLGRPRAVQEQVVPTSEISKSGPRLLQECSKSPPRAQDAPRCAREPSGDRFSPLGTSPELLRDTIRTPKKEPQDTSKRPLSGTFTELPKNCPETATNLQNTRIHKYASTQIGEHTRQIHKYTTRAH